MPAPPNKTRLLRFPHDDIPHNDIGEWKMASVHFSTLAMSLKMYGHHFLSNLMRYGLAYMQQTEAAYAEQVRARLERQLQRRAPAGL